MAYIGNTPAESYASFETETFTVSATTNYTLSHAVTNENEIRLVINGVVQQPGSGKAYTASGTTLTLSSATASGDVMYAVYLGRALQTVNPPNASVGASQLANDAVTTAKILDANVTSAKLASGVLPDNTPAFYATMSGNQSYSSSGAVQKVSFDSEYWDTASAYDASSNYRFTPQTAGKYLVYGCVYAATFANESMSGGAVYIKKNGSNYQGVAGNNTHNTPEFQTVGTPFSIAVEMNGSSDYIECYVQITFSSGTCNIYHDNNGKASFWGANKLIGV